MLDLELKYDLVGNLKERSDSVERKHETFKYDALDRLIEMTDSAGVRSRYAFDAAGRLTFKEGVGTYRYAQHQGENDGQYAKPFHAVLETDPPTVHHNFRYDLNGNMVSGPQGHFEYTTDNRVALIYADQDSWTRFDYGPSGDRFRQFVRNGASSTETLYVGGYERVTEYGSPIVDLKFGPLVRNRHYLSNGSGVFAVVETDAKYAKWSVIRQKSKPAARTIGELLDKQTWYLHSDQVGSVLRVTDENGQIRDRIWYDPWGARKSKIASNPTEGVQLGSSWKRGFAGQEHLDALSLIHMNGRMYSTFLATFLSVDPINQMAADTQGGNGYMYVRGNPLKFIDPSGYGFFGDVWHAVTAPFRAAGNAISDAARGIGHFFSEAGKWLSENWRMVVIVAVVIVIEVFTLGAATAALGPLAGAILTGMAAGAASGALGAALYGGTIDDVLAGAFKGAIVGGVSAAAFYGVGSYFQAAQGAQSSLTTSQEIESIAAHGVVGGAQQAAEGGDFVKGFIAGAVTKATSAYGPAFDGMAANVARAAIVGGTVAAVSGGKFANGAVVGAFSYAFNDSLHPSATPQDVPSRSPASEPDPYSLDDAFGGGIQVNVGSSVGIGPKMYDIFGDPHPGFSVSNFGGGPTVGADIEFTNGGTTITPNAGAAAPFGLGSLTAGGRVSDSQMSGSASVRGGAFEVSGSVSVNPQRLYQRVEESIYRWVTQQSCPPMGCR